MTIFRYEGIAMVRNRRGFGLIGGSIAFLVAMLGSTPGSGQDAGHPQSSLSEAARVAFPSAAQLRGADGVRWSFNNHRLVETSFGTLLISEGQPNQSDVFHAASGRLDVTYLRREGGHLYVRRRFPEAVRVGSHANIGQWSISDRFTSNPVIYAAGGFTGQGVTEGCTTLTELTPSGPRLIAMIPDGHDTSGSGLVPVESTEGRITEIARDRGFVVRYTGTRATVRRYVRQGDRFVRQGPPVFDYCNDE
jgi:hypothetical protein